MKIYGTRVGMTSLILDLGTRFTSFVSFSLQPYLPSCTDTSITHQKGRKCNKHRTQIRQRYIEKREYSIMIKTNTSSSTELYRGQGDKAILLSKSPFRSWIQPDDGYICIAETCSCFLHVWWKLCIDCTPTSFSLCLFLHKKYGQKNI